MRKTRYRGRRSSRRSHINPASIFGIIGGVLGIGVIAFVLCAVVISDNITACNEINLGGNIIGCTTDKKYSFDNIAIVSGNTKNTPSPSLSKVAKKYITNSFVSSKGGFYFSIFSASSAHNKINNSINMEKRESDTIEETANTINENYSKIEEAIQSEPIADGAEYLETIIKASKAIRGNSNDGDKSLIIVIGSGLSDGGLLDFTKGESLQSDAGTLFSKIKKSKELREGQLDGITILWSGIGEVVSPQNALNAQEKQVLEELYVMVLEDLGATVLDYDEIEPSNESIKTDHNVNTVKTNGVKCLWCDAKVFNSDELKFNPDSIEISDLQEALAKLNPLIEEMKKNSNEKVVITGYAARANHCGAFGGSDIPLGRANTIKQLLISRGIGEDRIEAVNGGHGGYNECENGSFSEEIAKKNRRIEFKAYLEG